MAYRRSGYGTRRRASTGYGRSYSARSRGSAGRTRYARGTVKRRAPARSARGRGQQTIKIVVEQAPASGVSRLNERVLSKMNPPPGKAKF